ncbi:MAG TPA: AMP-binding protein, partial [Verrucomicrobiae bacterium]|nr:AMP-binding protein [Verrucomicrobiae bacterium]
MKLFFRIALRILYRFRAFNTDVLTTPGPVLLIPNHTSWIDWLFLWCVLDDDWKFVTSSVTAQTTWLHRAIMMNRYTFPIDTSSPYAVKRMAEFLMAGGRLVLFAEGRLSLTGNIMKLFDGTGFLLFKTRAKVITAYLRGAKRLPLSPNKEKKLLFPKVTVHFSKVQGAPELHHVSTTHSRQILTSWLRDRLLDQQFQTEMEIGPKNLLAAVSEMARLQPSKIILEDALRQQLSYRRLLTGAELLGKVVSRVAAPHENRIGVLLPNINALPVLLFGLWHTGRTPAILNFSTGTATMLACAQLAGFRLVVTSRSFVVRAKLDLEPLQRVGIQFVFLEDLRTQISRGEKVLALLKQYFSPGLHNPALDSDQPAVVLFTSGSEGVPKGVELSHK